MIQYFGAFILAFLFLQTQSQAASSFSRHGIQFTVEPIVGYELNRRDVPSPHSKLMLIYGGRVVAGHPLFSGELEYTQGQDTEVYPGEQLTVREERQTAKLGVRSKFALTSWLNALGRLGGQANKRKIETITLSGSSTVTSPMEYRPYIGLGLEGAVSSWFSISTEAVYVMRSVSDLKQNDLQTTFSLKIGIPSK